MASEAKRLEYLGLIHTSGEHLLGLINDVLDLSKIESGRLEIERVPCSPQQILADVVSVLRVRANEKGIGLEYRWDKGVPETVLADPGRLRQLLVNLVGNAIKFTGRGPRAGHGSGWFPPAAARSWPSASSIPAWGFPATSGTPFSTPSFRPTTP